MIHHPLKKKFKSSCHPDCHVRMSVYMFHYMRASVHAETEKKPSPASAARLHDSSGRGGRPRRCLDTNVHSPTTIAPARSLWGAGEGMRGALCLGSNYCDRGLLTARTVSTDFPRKKFLRRWDSGRHLPIAVPANGTQHLENTAAEGKRKEEKKKNMHTCCCCSEHEQRDNSYTLLLLFFF